MSDRPDSIREVVACDEPGPNETDSSPALESQELNPCTTVTGKFSAKKGTFLYVFDSRERHFRLKRKRYTPL